MQYTTECKKHTPDFNVMSSGLVITTSCLAASFDVIAYDPQAGNWGEVPFHVPESVIVTYSGQIALPGVLHEWLSPEKSTCLLLPNAFLASSDWFCSGQTL